MTQIAATRLHGRWFDDPYAWLERLDDAETQAWIAAQEAVTRAVLDAVPGRELAAGRGRSLERAMRGCRRRFPPARTDASSSGRPTPSDEKLKLMLRRGKGAPLETVLDPNTWASDEVLVFAVPSPDGALVAFGKAVGSAHDAVIHVLDVETGRLLPDRPRGTQPRVAGLAARRFRVSSMPRVPSRARCPRATRRSGTPSTSTGSGRARRPAGSSATTT